MATDIDTAHRAHPHHAQPWTAMLPSHTPPSDLTSHHHAARLSHTHSDFWAVLRFSELARDWVFPSDPALDGAPSDSAVPSIALSHGAVAVYMCGEQGCATPQPETILARSSGMFFPVSQDASIVVGHYYERRWTPTSHSSAEMYRGGKYVLCTATQELFKITHVATPPGTTLSTTMCIDRSIMLSAGVFVRDFVMVSFAPPTTVATIPDPVVIHMRTTVLHKMRQTAVAAGIPSPPTTSSDFISPDFISPATSPADAAALLTNPSHGLHGFGMYDLMIIPSSGGFYRNTPRPSPPSAIGIWAPPQHMSACVRPLFLLVGLEVQEATQLRNLFLTYFTSQHGSVPTVPSPMPPAGPGPVAHPAVATGAAPGASSAAPRRRGPAASTAEQPASIGVSALSARMTAAASMSSSLPSRHVTGPVAGPSFPYSEPAPNLQRASASQPIRAQSSRALPGSHPHPALSSAGLDVSTLLFPTPGSTTAAGESAQSAPIPLLQMSHFPMVEQTGVKIEQDLQRGEGRTHLHAHQQKASAALSSGQDILATPLAALRSPTKAASGSSGAGTTSTGTAGAGSSTLPSVRGQTLAAPTQSEIVMRNRISAQKSNEKRRKKIEATKVELGYLKSTVVPQLETAKDAMKMENLRLREVYQSKYGDDDLRSFFVADD